MSIRFVKAIEYLYQELEQAKDKKHEQNNIFVADISDREKIAEAIEDLDDILAYTKAVGDNNEIILFS